MTHEALAVIRKARINEFFARAIDTDEYRNAVALREQALKRRTTLPAVNPPTEPTAPGELDAWLDSLTKFRAAQQDRELQYQALTSLIGNCDARIVAVVDLEPDAVLAALADDLKTLLSDVDAAVSRLKGTRSAAEAISAGVTDVWNELSTLRANYNQLRSAQRFVMGAEVSNYGSTYLFDDEHANRLFVRNIDTIFPGWRTPDTSRVTLSGVAPDPRPWPTDDPVAQLVWLATNAVLWIPTHDELRELETELHRRNNPQPEVIPGRHDQRQKKTVGTIR